MYQTEGPNNRSTALELYLSKLNTKCDAFFQFLKRNWSPENVWYENRCLGVNKLGNMIELCSSAKQSKVYTKCSVQATEILCGPMQGCRTNTSWQFPAIETSSRCKATTCIHLRTSYISAAMCLLERRIQWQQTNFR